MIITKDHMDFTSQFYTTILKLYILTLPLSVRSMCKAGKQGNSSQIKQKYQFGGSLVPRPLNFMVLYYYIPEAGLKKINICMH